MDKKIQRDERIILYFMLCIGDWIEEAGRGQCLGKSQQFCCREQRTGCNVFMEKRITGMRASVKEAGVDAAGKTLLCYTAQLT